jgi:ABC-type uncharacterized transport system substrate-binding protein
VFAEARLEVDTSANGQITELRHVWRFDEVFSSSVMLDFDRNGNFELDMRNWPSISEVVTASLARISTTTQSLTVNGGDWAFNCPKTSRWIPGRPVADVLRGSAQDRT